MELLFKTKKSLRDYLSKNSVGKSLGFVPTMGALHQGHLSLLKRARSENELTLISIFVNPTQFNNAEDLEKYPNTLEEDLKLINEIAPSIIVFSPSIEEMYQDQVHAKHYQFEGIDLYLEGQDRPGHFDGVGTIVEALFNVIRPTRAYFGEKDFQQLLIVKSLVKQLQLPIEICSCPIVREENGLAMSSRNTRLTPEQQVRAAFIYDSLKLAVKLASELPALEVKKKIELLYKNQNDFSLNYFEIVDVTHFQIVEEFLPNSYYRFLIAVEFHQLRLIDNIGYETHEVN